MQALFMPLLHGGNWCSKYFSHHSLCSLPVAGKPAAEYCLDLCHELGIENALILDTVYQPRFASYLSLRKHHFIPFRYQGAPAPANPSALMKRHERFIQADDCLLFHGAVLPRIQSAEDFFSQFIPVDAAESDGIYRLERSGAMSKYNGPLYQLNSLNEYFEINFTFLSEKFYIIPGYREANHCITGIHVVTAEDTSLKGRILIGDRSRIESGCILRHGVIVGANTLITENNTLDHCLVFDHTYVPQNLVLHRKIVTESRIIDPSTGGQIKRRKMSGFCLNFENLRRLSLRCLKQCLALLLLVIYTPPALILLPFCRGRRSFHSIPVRCLGRYNALFEALRGKRQLIHSYSGHAPAKAVFSMAACYSPAYTSFQRQFYGRFFTEHQSWKLIFLVVWKNFLGDLRRRR